MTMAVTKFSVDNFQWLSLSVIIVLALIKLVQRINFSSTFRHIPGPKAYPLLGNCLDIVGKSTTEFFTFVSEQCATYKGSFVLWVGPYPKVYFLTPENTQTILSSTEYIDKSLEYNLLDDWLGTGLVTSSGPKWHHRRKILTPAFHYNILETMLEPIQHVADILVERLRDEADKEEEEANKGFNVLEYMKLAALDVICETTMGYYLGALKNLNSNYIKAVQIVTEISMKRFMNPLLQYDMLFKRTEQGRTYYKELAVIHDFTLGVIKERRQLLLQKLSNNEEQSDEKYTSGSKKRPTAFLDLCLQLPELSDSDVREEVDTFMFAGHDTTAGVASFTLFALGHHPDIQKRIVQEAESVGFYDGPPTAQTLASMEYLERCIKESLRLYPPVPVIARQLYQPLKTPSMVVPAGCAVFIHVYEQHRNPEYFPEPNRFNPDRFLEKFKHPYAYVPFSAGPRNCIGQKVAMISQKILIANILRKYVVQSLVKPEDLHLAQNIVLESEGGLKVRLKYR
uniref:Cytochrome P450 4C1 n=1 Tax=Cacopsylla melanoneura TaxID=428564 RepID=A0A8D8RJ80_9HEMI